MTGYVERVDRAAEVDVGYTRRLSSFATVEDHTTTAGAATSTNSADDPLVVRIQHVVQEEYGLTITDDQARCLFETTMYTDPADPSPVYAALYTCGADVFDVPSG